MWMYWTEVRPGVTKPHRRLMADPLE
jgi:hypothetical protein